jgi:beta-phosphoglucomutase-like phosphatase (HAD superfamily)
VKPKAVILDVDGTLVDSNDAHARAWVEALAEHGHQVPFAEVRRLIGMGGDKLLPLVTASRRTARRARRSASAGASSSKPATCPS